jgi:branched-chain amino acid transport system permease protein
MTPRRVLGWTALCVLAAAACLSAAAYAPRGLPVGIVVIGLLVGGLNGLVAIGLVLVYRAGSYINFAQGGIGAVGAIVAAKLITLEGVPYPIACLAGLATAGLGAVLVERAVVQRLFTAPRLILTVATIGAAQLFGGLQGLVEVNWRDPLHLTPRLQVPWHVTASIGSVLLRGEDFVAMIAIPLLAIGLTWFLNRTTFGTALQAAAENPDRARLLGINVRRMSSLVWLIAGLLAGATAILEAPIVGFSFGSGSDIGLLLRALAPAMVARMTSMPTAFVAALGLGVAEQAIAWNTDTSGAVDAMLFAVVLVALLVRRPARGRTADAEERSFAAASQIRPFPRELVRLPWLRLTRIAVGGLPIVVALLLPLLMSVSSTNLLSVLLVYVLAAASLTVITGYSGQVSFGQWALVGGSALFGGWLMTSQHVTVVPAFAVTLLAGTAASVLVGLPALRVRGLLLGVTTLALAVAASSYLFTLAPFRPGDLLTRGRLLGLDLDSERTFYYVTLLFTVLALLLVRSYRRSRWGRAAIAVRDNEPAASSYGIEPVAVKLVAFGMSGLLASLAGFLYMLAEQTLNAGAFPVSTSLLLFGAVIIGGVGSVTGAVVAALYLRGIQFFAPSLQLLTTSFGLLIVLVMLPTGVGGLLLSVRDRILRSVALRAGIHVPSLVADSRQESSLTTAAAPVLDEPPVLSGVVA